jgi:two-component system response regulator NreC
VQIDNASRRRAQTELIEAVRQVAAGSTYINPELGVRLAREPEDEGPPDGLSEREAEIVGLVALYETRAELVRYAVEHGLVEPDDSGTG